MSSAATQAPVRGYLSSLQLRFDRWRDFTVAAQVWAQETGAQRQQRRSDVSAQLAGLKELEDFQAYPGRSLMKTLSDRIDADDASGTARLAQQLSRALLTRSYREDPSEWEAAEEGVSAEASAMRLPSTEGHKPYFEVLVVNPTPSSRWAAASQDLRRLRRSQDQFTYETVMVGNFEDALIAAAVNYNIEAVVIADGFSFHSQHKAPLLRGYLETNGVAEAAKAVPGEYGTMLARMIKKFRPELDIYLLSDRHVEAIAGDATLSCIRRVFYQVEEPLEIHLSILDGVAARFETPYFDNLKRYSQRPIGTFHALPVARGKSIFKSNWIRDMGEFYGITLFLAESSATTGGLDSLLEPTGTIKRAQDMAARAFGADHVFFVTNGTSTSNKMIEQALLTPGDIVIVDRNCHKSHHYGMVLAGAQPLYVEAYPMMQYSMYGGVPLKGIKQAMMDLKAEGRLSRLKMVVLTNCTFDGHMYNPRRVMEECLAIKPDLIFLWDEAWFGFARFNPFLRPRTAMAAAEDIQDMLADPNYRQRYDAERKKFGEALDSNNKKLLDLRLLPDPDKTKVRVYQSNSTHKSMSSLRQGSMVLVRDEDFHKVEAAFHEAVFTHASTSPNLQIIASLDVARRQMELEGYEMTTKSIQLALDLRREINNHKLISKYFKMLTPEEMIPAEYRPSGFADYAKENWVSAMRASESDEFFLDPTRLTLVCGTAGFDGTQFKGLLASQYGIQLNKTSRNSVLFQTNINNTRSDIAHLLKVLAEISLSVERELKAGGEPALATFRARVKALMEDVPNLPNFSTFHDAFRDDPSSKTVEGDMRAAFYAAYDEPGCEYIKITDPKIDQRIKSGPPLVSANFVIPYPPGFPIMVPGQIITAETIEFMRKLDVKEIHGYEKTKGLKLLRPDVLEASAPKSAGKSAIKAKPRRDAAE